MCLSQPKAPPPAPPPPAPAPPAPVPELKTTDQAADPNDPAGMKKGRRKLRIDMNGATASGEGSGLNIPQ